MKPLLHILLLLNCFSAIGQNSTKDQIEEIRSRFYGLNKVELTSLKIDSNEYFFENDKLRKVVQESSNQSFEYYFDLDYISNYAYFIFTIDRNNNKQKENRYYFGKDNDLILWLNPDKQEVDLNDESNCIKKLELIALATDILTSYNNYLLNKKHPDYDELVDYINLEISKYSQAELKKDTIEINSVPEEYYYSHKVEFRNRKGQKIKSISFSGGDHGSQTTTSYFNLNGNLIYEHQKSDDVFGHSNSRHFYWKDDKIFRTIEMATVNGDWNNCRQFQHTFVNKIYDY